MHRLDDAIAASPRYSRVRQLLLAVQNSVRDLCPRGFGRVRRVQESPPKMDEVCSLPQQPARTSPAILTMHPQGLKTQKQKITVSNGSTALLCLPPSCHQLDLPQTAVPSAVSDADGRKHLPGVIEEGSYPYHVPCKLFHFF
jgi:hypothetical protein